MPIGIEKIEPMVQKLVELTGVNQDDLLIVGMARHVLDYRSSRCDHIELRSTYEALYKIKAAFDEIMLSGERQVYCVSNIHGDSGINLEIRIGKFTIIGCKDLSALKQNLKKLPHWSDV